MGNSAFGWAFLVCFTLLVVKGWDRLVEAHLWAEDGTEYLQESLTNPWFGVFQPFAGYFHVFQRLAIHVLALFPLAWLPALIAVTTYVLYALFAAQFARPAFRDYVPSDSARVVTSAMLVFVPGMGEVAGNYVNLFRPMFLFTWLVALKPPRHALRTWELLALALFAVSVGQAVFVLPLLLFRLFYQVREHQERPVIRREVTAILVVLVGGIISALQPAYPSTLPRWPLDEIISTSASLLPRVTVYQPWLGPRWTNELGANQGVLLWLAGVLILGVITWALVKKRGLAGRQLLVGLLAVYAIWPLTFMIRPESLLVFTETPFFFWASRYGYQMAPFAVILWATLLLYRFPYQKGSRLAAAAFVIVYLFTNQGYSTIPAYGTELDWQAGLADIDQLDDTGCPLEVFIPIYPIQGLGPRNNWGVVFPGELERCLATLTGALENKQPIPASPHGGSAIVLDQPAPGSSVEPSFVVSGWAIDRRASDGTGVEDADVWAVPMANQLPIFLGRSHLGGGRPDVGEVFGSQFSASGYSLSVSGLAPGKYDLVVAAYSDVTDSFDVSVLTPITVIEPG